MRWLVDNCARSIMIVIALFLAACQSLPNVGQLPELTSLKRFHVIDYQHEQDGLQSLLIIEPQTRDTWRWLQLDALGAPISRQVLQDGQWHNDGFLPPNRHARALFIAVYYYLLQKAQLSDTIDSDLAEIQIEQLEKGVLLSWRNKQWFIKELADE